MLFSSSSVVANAKFEEIADYRIYAQGSFKPKNSTNTLNMVSFSFTPGNGEVENSFIWKMVNVEHLGGQGKMLWEYYIANNDGTAILTDLRETTIKIENVRQNYGIYKDPFEYEDLGAEYGATYVPISAVLYYGDGSVGYGTVSMAGDDITIKATPTQDVQKIAFTTEVNINRDQDVLDYGVLQSDGTYRVAICARVGEIGNDSEFAIKVEVSSEEAGFLKSMIEGISDLFESVSQGFANLWTWLGTLVDAIKDGFADLWDSIQQGFHDVLDWFSSVYYAILDGFANLWDGIQSVVDTLLGLPAKIWGFIENGLHKLFVPGTDFMVDFSENWDSLLENKFGAVYEVVSLTFDSWDRIQASNEQNTITIPQTSINLPEGVSFSFGGQDVRIVPQGFEWLATTIKTFVGGLCTIMFVNGLRKRYDEVMGVEQ